MDPLSGDLDEVRISGIGRQSWEFNVNMARISIFPDSLDFDRVVIGNERSLKLWIDNPGVLDESCGDPATRLRRGAVSLDFAPARSPRACNVDGIHSGIGQEAGVVAGYAPADLLGDDGYVQCARDRLYAPQ